MSKISLRLKSFLLAPTLFLLPLLTPNVANAAVKIKNTNYPYPNNAYFVSPNGKNNNSGKSPRSPIPVEKAIALAPRGATIVFRGGTYRDVNANKITKKLTLQAFPREKPLLKGSTIVQGWVADGSTWRKDGWTYSFRWCVRLLWDRLQDHTKSRSEMLTGLKQSRRAKKTIILR
jgi:hypothetical protein